jgi:hypothetical protein
VRKVIAADNSPSSDHLLHAQIEGMDIEVLANFNKERRGISGLFPKAHKAPFVRANTG